MSRKFLTNIDLNSNELRNGVIHNLATDPGTGVAGQLYFNTVDNTLKVYTGSVWEAVGSAEFIGDAVADLLDAGYGIELTYDDAGDSLTVANTGVVSLAGTSNEVVVSASSGSVTLSLPSNIHVDVTGDLTGNADTASTFETSRTISLGGSLSGSVTFDGSQDVTITADIVADSVALGADTTGDYVAGASASGAGISVTGSGGEGSSLVISNTGVTSIEGTANEISVSGSTGLVTISLPDDVTIGGNLVVTGDLTVSGSVTTLNTETLLVEDNQITLNSNVTGTPSADAGLEIERGDSTNASLIWDESADKWAAGLIGSETAISLEGHTHVASDVTDFDTAVDAEIDSYLTGSDSISISSGSIDATLAASTPFLTKVGGLAVDKSSLESALISDGFPKKYAEANGSLTSSGGVCTWTVTHSLATKDVTVQVYEVAADYSQVEVDVQHTSTSAITIKINSASTITADTYRVVVIG
jgi:uncharacterized cupin superfamily protein/uncharacterized protein YijF (DUF1287 family)